MRPCLGIIPVGGASLSAFIYTWPDDAGSGSDGQAGHQRDTLARTTEFTHNKANLRHRRDVLRVLDARRRADVRTVPAEHGPRHAKPVHGRGDDAARVAGALAARI